MNKIIYLLTLITVFILFSCEENKPEELVCKDGYRLSSDKQYCNDINECLFGGACEETCINTQGSFECECQKEGYIANEQGKCVDLDECSIDNGGCQHNCVNEDGYFKCFCQDGYLLSDDGKTCDDINNCNINSCQNHGSCIDEIESYSCECFDNYKGDNCELCIEGYEFYGTECLIAPVIVEWGSNNIDIPSDFVMDSQDNIYILGSTYGSFDGYTNNGNINIFLTKLNSNLDILWTKQFEDIIELESEPSMIMDNDENLYIVSTSTGNIPSLILIKLKNTGDLIWRKLRNSGHKDRAFDIILDKDKNTESSSTQSIYISGFREGDLDPNTEELEKILVIKKFTSLGEEEWTKEEYTNGENFSYNMAIDENDNLYVATITKTSLDDTNNIGGNDILIIKYDNSGNKLWNKQLGSNTHDNVSSIVINDNKIYLTGYTNGHFSQFDHFGKGDIYIKKLDLDGNIIFEKSWNEGRIHQGTSSSINDIGEIYLAAYSDNNDFSRKMILKKLDINGELIWNREWNPLEDDSLGVSLKIGKNKSLYNLAFRYNKNGSYNPFMLKFDFK